ncbi:MAG TPA: hypothetical protein VJM09_05100 [Sphingobium sp.]|nr:hypothetical protein [Sphingobium sp.]
MRWISPAALLVLAACQRGDLPASSSSIEASASSGTGLERAAIESGVIEDSVRVSPVGLYQRNHEAGRDALCVIPGKGGDLRFGLEAEFGEEQSCRGRGTARRAGDKLILSFSGGDHCIIVGQYDGDQLSIPGVVDMKCADICQGRGSLEGVSFPRIAGEAAAALQARDRRGDPLCDPT